MVADMRRSVFALAFLAAAGIGACDDHGHDDGHDHDQEEVPAPYAGMTNPMDGDSSAAAAGQALYAQHCVKCHGPNGHGNGVEAAGLNPAPPNFHDATLTHPDDYLMWRISEGGSGDPVQSDMPAWKMELSTDQIWQLITYLRNLPTE